ncbi:uncharacterized protein [Montipora foliosa]|uniref:uncharacterized protein isoform X2 n=1 Tax=Montipora foliosa TaxID=591990 RepID=UPI0035F1B7F3
MANNRDGNASSFVGARLRIKTGEGEYEGTVHTIDVVKRKLTLTKVVCCSTGSKLHGFHHFFGHELNNLELLDEPKDNNTNSQPTRDKNNDDTKENEDLPKKQGESLSTDQNRPALRKSSVGSVDSTNRGIRKAFLDAGIGINSKLGVKKTEVSSGSLSRDASDEGNRLLKKTPIQAEKYLSDMLSDEEEKENMSPGQVPATAVIDSFGDAFEEAVKFVSKQRVIGIGCEGVNIGRYGKLCWLVVGCSKVIYLFDILVLGASCFDEGLQDILESGDILKVIHDCRQVSDALFHQYRIRLINVFDTQVADVIIYKNERAGELPRHVNGLVACLYEYLNLSPEHVHFQKVRLKHMQGKASIWAERPSPAALVDAAAKHVMYLRELRLAQMERIMAEFIYGVDIYLSLVRDAKEVNPKIKGQVLPSKFHSLNQFSYRHRSRRYDGDFHEDAINGVPQDVLATREAWNEGQEFSEEYENKKGRVKERKYGPPKIAPPAPLEIQPGGPDLPFSNVKSAGPVHNVVDKLRQAMQDSASGSDSEGSNASIEGTTLLSGAIARELPEKAATMKPAAVMVPSAVSPVFTVEDFPPLSSSESEGPGSPPRLASVKNVLRHSEGRLERHVPRKPGHGSDSLGAQSISTLRVGQLLRESAAIPGRGRAGALLRHAKMPALRLPTEDSPLDGAGYNCTQPQQTKINEFLFPSDDELLTAPEITPVPRNQISGGTQVRIRQM